MTLTYSEIGICYGELSTKVEEPYVSSINFAIISKMFYLFIRCQSDSGPRSSPCLSTWDGLWAGGRIPAKFWNPKFFTLLTRLKISTSLKKRQCKIMTRFYTTAWPLKLRSVWSHILNSIAALQSNSRWRWLWSDPNDPGTDEKARYQSGVETEEVAHISMKLLWSRWPPGTSGKGTLMLSGGIDSPAAGYLALKRGVDIEAVHRAHLYQPRCLKKPMT